MFEIGFEHNNEPMNLTKDEWDAAYQRLEATAKKLHADCQLLLTKNVGGPLDGTPTKERIVPGK